LFIDATTTYNTITYTSSIGIYRYALETMPSELNQRKMLLVKIALALIPAHSPLKDVFPLVPMLELESK